MPVICLSHFDDLASCVSLRIKDAFVLINSSLVSLYALLRRRKSIFIASVAAVLVVLESSLRVFSTLFACFFFCTSEFFISKKFLERLTCLLVHVSFPVACHVIIGLYDRSVKPGYAKIGSFACLEKVDACATKEIKKHTLK